MTDTDEALGPSSYLEHAGKRAPEGVKNTLCENTPLYMKDGLPYHVSNGYLVPCYFPKEYNGNGANGSKSTRQEVKDHKALYRLLSQRYFRSVERGDPDEPPTRQQLDYILAQYTRAKEAEKSDLPPEEATHMVSKATMDKERWGALYVGGLVNRAEALAATVYKQKQQLNGEAPDSPPDKRSISVDEKELHDIVQILFSPDNEFLKCVRLAGNRKDMDDIVLEMLSEVGKALYTVNGDLIWKTRQLKENHVSKIADAMRMMDKTHDFMGGLLDSTTTPPHTLTPLRNALEEFTDAARTRVAIDVDHDKITYYHAEVDYKTARRKVDTIIDYLQTAHGHNPDLTSTLEQVREGRKLIDDMCFYRRDFKETFTIYMEKCTAPAQAQSGDAPALQVQRHGNAREPLAARHDGLTP